MESGIVTGGMRHSRDWSGGVNEGSAEGEEWSLVSPTGTVKYGEGSAEGEEWSLSPRLER